MERDDSLILPPGCLDGLAQKDGVGSPELEGSIIQKANLSHGGDRGGNQMFHLSQGGWWHHSCAHEGSRHVNRIHRRIIVISIRKNVHGCSK
eukprot:scaffold76306_cov46-Attheya_sp.AAC.2